MLIILDCPSKPQTQGSLCLVIRYKNAILICSILLQICVFGARNQFLLYAKIIWDNNYFFYSYIFFNILSNKPSGFYIRASPHTHFSPCFVMLIFCMCHFYHLKDIYLDNVIVIFLYEIHFSYTDDYVLA